MVAGYKVRKSECIGWLQGKIIRSECIRWLQGIGLEEVNV